MDFNNIHWNVISQDTFDWANFPNYYLPFRSERFRSTPRILRHRRVFHLPAPLAVSLPANFRSRMPSNFCTSTLPPDIWMQIRFLLIFICKCGVLPADLESRDTTRMETVCLKGEKKAMSSWYVAITSCAPLQLSLANLLSRTSIIRINWLQND